MGREKWDGRIVPQDPRKKVETAEGRGGKAVTVNQSARQLELFCETADSPQGDVASAEVGWPTPAGSAVPKSQTEERTILPAMTLEEVASQENLQVSLERVCANKGAPGPDRQTIADVERHSEKILSGLRQVLLAGDYQPGLIRRVWIPKPGGGKRGLGIPNVVDRIVAQAVHQVMSPHYEPTFHDSSHGFRPGRSCHTAIAEARKYLEEGHEWVIDLDLEKFFDRVNHDRLMAALGTKVKDPRLLKLIRRMLKAKVVMPDGVVVNTEEGTPQGGPLSPLLSNIVLDELDRELARRGHRFARYADDCNIYVNSKRAGERVMVSITEFIEQRLRLKVNRDKSAVDLPRNRHFLGFSLEYDPEDGEVEICLSKRSKERIAMKIRELTPRNWGQSIRDCIGAINQYLKGWFDFFSICTTQATWQFKAIDAHIRRRLRAAILKQWRCKRIIFRKLLAMGVKRSTANTIYGSKFRLSSTHDSMEIPVENGTCFRAK
jgi:group II intron reverse transcriptase/maturase